MARGEFRFSGREKVREGIGVFRMTFVCRDHYGMDRGQGSESDSSSSAPTEARNWRGMRVRHREGKENRDTRDHVELVLTYVEN